MQVTAKALIFVVGALSKQRGSVVRFLLESQRYCIRALTRRLDSPEAKELVSLGAEFVQAPLELGHKTEFIQSVNGAHGVFMMTPSVSPEAPFTATHEAELGQEHS